jgi:hypothetical protein
MVLTVNNKGEEMDFQALVKDLEAKVIDLGRKIKEQEALLLDKQEILKIESERLDKQLSAIRAQFSGRAGAIKLEQQNLEQQLVDLAAKRSEAVAEIARLVEDKKLVIDGALKDKRAELRAVTEMVDRQRLSLQASLDKARELKQLAAKLPE